MRRGARWVRWGIVGLLATLVFGRWVAVTVADYWWADALGAADAFADITALRLSLFLWVFSTALLWCTGNLYLVYRSIGSVHVPRRLANIEIVEAVPRSYLAAAVMIVGAILAFAISHSATDWWVIRAVSDTEATVGLTDPILGREAAYYLFRLPWHRLLHGFSTLAAGLMLGVVLLLYVAVGAVRFAGRRVEVSEMARRHLGGLLAAFAAALVWGYRLEPVEFVAGLQNVPLDAVLTEVRLPTSRLLSALGLMALITSLLWMRYDRLAIPVFGWVALVTFSLVGHYVVPAVAARARSSEGSAAGLGAVERDFRSHAFGVTAADTLLMTTGTLADSAMIRRAPVWDGFAATVAFNRLQTDSVPTHVVNASLSAARAPDGTVYPIYVGVPEVDLAGARQEQRELSWEAVHAGQLIATRGVYAMRADTMSSEGLPLYLSVVREPQDVEARPRHLRSVHRTVTFGVGTSEYAVVPSDAPAAENGIPVSGLVRRLALAWRLQTPRFLGPNTVTNDRVAVWERDARRRLERVAPFAAFGVPFPVLVDETVQWVAYGYVSREGFPLAPPVAWRDQRVRYLRVGFLGIVDGHTGATQVHVMPDADVVSRAWAERFPGVIREADQVSRSIVDQLPYPSEWFDRQVRLVRDPQMRERFPGFFQLGAPPSTDSVSTRKAWWVGPAPGDTTPRLRLRAAIQRGDPPALSALVDATMRHGRPRFVVYRLRAPYDEAAPGEAASQFALLQGTGEGISGVVRTVPLDAGLLHYQAYYETPDDGEPGLPRLREVHASWKQGVGVGPSLWDAWDRARALVPADRPEPAPWATARHWLQRLDEARRRGDWDAFGDAYQALLELFELPRDSGG